MAFGQLSYANVIALNAPKYTRIVEPFADSGTVALYPGMKKPREHIVNLENENTFNILAFIQTYTTADKNNLKAREWVSSAETFEKVLAMDAKSGTDLFYQFFYLKKFGVRAKDPEQPPTFDYLKRGQNMGSIIFTLPGARIGIKKVTLTNSDPLSVKLGGPGTFNILAPKKPEHIAAIESQLSGMTGAYFYAKKSMSNDDIFLSVDSGTAIISTFAASSIMMQTMEVRTNYSHKSRKKLRIVEPIGEK